MEKDAYGPHIKPHKSPNFGSRGRLVVLGKKGITKKQKIDFVIKVVPFDATVIFELKHNSLV